MGAARGGLYARRRGARRPGRRASAGPWPGCRAGRGSWRRRRRWSRACGRPRPAAARHPSSSSGPSPPPPPPPGESRRGRRGFADCFALPICFPFSPSVCLLVVWVSVRFGAPSNQISSRVFGSRKGEHADPEEKRAGPGPDRIPANKKEIKCLFGGLKILVLAGK